MLALQNKELISIRSAALDFKVAKSALSDRLSRVPSQSDANNSAQILSSTEEATLVQWITRLTATGYPVTPAWLKEMDREIKNRQLQVASCQMEQGSEDDESWSDAT